MPKNDDRVKLMQELPLESDLPIIDPHHHLRDRPDNHDLLDQIVADLARCQNVALNTCGAQMPVNTFGWHERAILPSSDELAAGNARWSMHANEAFGPARVRVFDRR